MSRMHFSAGKPSGWAACRICGKLITDGVQVTASGWLTRGSVHLGCLLDDYLLRIQIDHMLAGKDGGMVGERDLVCKEVKV